MKKVSRNAGLFLCYYSFLCLRNYPAHFRPKNFWEKPTTLSFVFPIIKSIPTHLWVLLVSRFSLTFVNVAA